MNEEKKERRDPLSNERGRPRVLFKVLQERIAVSRKTFTWAPRTFPGQQRRAIHHLLRTAGCRAEGSVPVTPESRPTREERGARCFFPGNKSQDPTCSRSESRPPRPPPSYQRESGNGFPKTRRAVINFPERRCSKMLSRGTKCYGHSASPKANQTQSSACWVCVEHRPLSQEGCPQRT